VFIKVSDNSTAKECGASSPIVLEQAEHIRDLHERFSNATLLGSPEIYSHEPPVDCQQLRFPVSAPGRESTRLRSSLCTRHQLDSPAFRYWALNLKEEWRLHRKIWEFCFIMQALYERDMLQPGRRGLGFAVGREPLPALMARMGVSVVASDLDVSDQRAEAWTKSNEFAGGEIDCLNDRAICDPEEFRKLVSLRAIDMNEIPEDAIGFDFCWSSCAFEHCGSIGLGMRFIREQMKCLRPGGIAVHTTEYNLGSVEKTIESGDTVIFRRQDIEAMIRQLRAEGHDVEPLQLDLGTSLEDAKVDVFPYCSDQHLKLKLFDNYVTTSIGLILRASTEEKSHARQRKAG
jgi:SAM-dependent methyltransferase